MKSIPYFTFFITYQICFMFKINCIGKKFLTYYYPKNFRCDLFIRFRFGFIIKWNCLHNLFFRMHNRFDESTDL